MKTNKLGKILVVALFVMLFVLVLTVSVNAADASVDTADGLTTALGNAESGDTVTVTATIEIASDTTITVPEGVTVQGSVSPLIKVTGTNATLTVSGAGTISGTGNVIEAAEDGVKVLLNGCTLTTTGDNNDGAIVIDRGMGTNTTVEVNGATLTTDIGWAIDFYDSTGAATGTGKKVVKMTAGSISSEHVIVFTTKAADLGVDIQLTGGSITSKNSIVYLRLAHSTNKAVVALSGTTLKTTGSDKIINVGTSSVAEVTMTAGDVTAGGVFVSVIDTAKVDFRMTAGTVTSGGDTLSIGNSAKVDFTMTAGTVSTAGYFALASSTVASTFNIQGGEITSTKNANNNGLFWITTCTTATTKVTVSGGKITSLQTPLVGIDGSKAVPVETTISGTAEISTHSLINENSGNGKNNVTISGGKIDLGTYVFSDAGGSANAASMEIAMTGGELTATGIYQAKTSNNFTFTMTGGTYNGHAYVEPANGEQLAQIGSTYYASLQKAIDSITDDSEPVTITLLGAHTIDETVEINKNVIITGGSADAEIVVTNAITSLTDGCGYNAFQVAAGKSVTFTGYVYYLLCTVFPMTEADKTTTVTFAGNVYFDNDRATYTLRANSTTCTGGKLTVNVQENAYLRAFHVINSGASITCEVNVSGGTLESTDSSAIYIASATYAKITVSGGKFTGASNALRPVSTHCDIEVTGGTFDISGHLVYGTSFTGTVTVSGDVKVTSCNYAFYIEAAEAGVTSALTDTVTVKKDQTNTMSATPDVVVTVSGNVQINSKGRMFQIAGNLHTEINIEGAVQMNCQGDRFFYLKDYSNDSTNAGEWTVVNVGADAQGNAPTLKFAGSFLQFDSVGANYSYYNLNVSAGTVESTATSGAYAFIWAGDANARMIVNVTGGTFRRAEGVTSTGTLSFVGYSSNPVVYVDASDAIFEDLTTFWTDVRLDQTTTLLSVTAYLQLSGVSVSGSQTDTFPALFHMGGTSKLELTITGGTYTATTHRGININNGTCTVTIDNATITSEKEVFAAWKSTTACTLTIKKGTFTSLSERVLYTNATTSTVTLGYEGMTDDTELVVVTNAASAKQVLANHNETDATYTLTIWGGTYVTRKTNLIDINKKVGGSITIHGGVFTLTNNEDNYFIDVAGDNSDPKTMNIVINGGTVTDCFGLIHCHASKGKLEINGGSFKVSQNETVTTSTDILRGAIWLQASTNDYACVIQNCEITVVGKGTDQGMLLHVTNGKVDMTIKGTTTKLTATLEDTNLAMFNSPNASPAITITVDESPEITCTNGPIFGVSGALTANIKGGTLTGKWLLNANGQVNKITANIYDGATVKATDALHTDGTKVASGDMQYKNVINIYGGSITAPRLYSNNTLMQSFTYVNLMGDATVNGYSLTLTDATTELVQVAIAGQEDTLLFDSLAAALASDAVKTAAGKVTVTLLKGDTDLDATPNDYGDETMEIYGDVEITGEDVKMLYNGQGYAFHVNEGASLTLSGSVTWLWGHLSAEANTTVTYQDSVVVDCSTSRPVYTNVGNGDAAVYVKGSVKLVGSNVFYIYNVSGNKTIDVAGGTITASSCAVNLNSLINSTVTVNFTDVVVEAASHVVYVVNTAGSDMPFTTNVTVSGGTYSCQWGIFDMEGSDAEGTDMNVTIWDGTFINNKTSGDTYMFYTADAQNTMKMYIYGGTFKAAYADADVSVFRNNGKELYVDIYGGTFSGNLDRIVAAYRDDTRLTVYTSYVDGTGATVNTTPTFNATYIIYADANQKYTNSCPQIVLNGGSYTATEAIFYTADYADDGNMKTLIAKIEIKGGTYNAKYLSYQTAGTICSAEAPMTVSGGTFTVTEDVFYSEGGTLFVTVSGGDFTVTIPDGEAGWDPEEIPEDDNSDGEAKYQRKYGTTIHWCFANLNNSTGSFTMSGGTVTGAKYGIHVAGKAAATAITETVSVYKSMDKDGNKTLYETAAPDFIVVVSGGSITAEYRAISLDGDQKSVVRISGTASLTATTAPVVNGHRHAVVYRENESTTSYTWTVVEMSGGTVTTSGPSCIFALGPVNYNDRAYMNVNITGGKATSTKASTLINSHDWQGTMLADISGDFAYTRDNGTNDNTVAYSYGQDLYLYLHGSATFENLKQITSLNRASAKMVVVVDESVTITGIALLDSSNNANYGFFYINGKDSYLEVYVKGCTLIECDNGPLFGPKGHLTAVVSGGTLKGMNLVNSNSGEEAFDITVTGGAITLTNEVFHDAGTAGGAIDVLVSGGELTASAIYQAKPSSAFTFTITGGFYNGAGHVLNEQGVAAITVGDATTYYGSLQAAIDAVTGDTAAAPVTITLVGVVTVDTTVVINKNVIITGNGGDADTPLLVHGRVTDKVGGVYATFKIMPGYAVTFSGNVRYLTCGFYMAESAEGQSTTVTFTDKVNVNPISEKAASGSTEGYAFEILNSDAKGSLTLNVGGEAYLAGTHAIRLQSAMDITLNITGGTIYANAYTAVYVRGGNATVKMSNGTFNGTTTAFQFLDMGTSDVEITGGKFEMTDGQVVLFRAGKHSLTMKNVTVNGPKDLVNVQNGGTLGTAESPALIENVTVTKLTGSFAYFNQGTHYLTVKDTTVSAVSVLINVASGATLGSAAVPAVLENVTATVTNHVYYSDWAASAGAIHVKSGTYTNTTNNVLMLSRTANETIIMGTKDGTTLGSNSALSMITRNGRQVFGAHCELHNGKVAANRGIYNLTIYNGTYTTISNLIDLNQGLEGSITIHSGIFTVETNANNIIDIGGTADVDTETGDHIGYNAIDVTVKSGTFNTKGRMISAAYHFGDITVEGGDYTIGGNFIYDTYYTGAMNFTGGTYELGKYFIETTYATAVISVQDIEITACSHIFVIRNKYDAYENDAIAAKMAELGYTDGTASPKQGLSSAPHNIITVKDSVLNATYDLFYLERCGSILLDVSGDDTEVNVGDRIAYRRFYAEDDKNEWAIANISGGTMTAGGATAFSFPGTGTLKGTNYVSINVSGGSITMTKAAVKVGATGEDGTKAYLTEEHHGVVMFEVYKWAVHMYLNITGGTFTYAPVGTVGEGQVAPESYFVMGGSQHTEVTMTGGTVNGFDIGFIGNYGGNVTNNEGTFVTLGKEGGTSYPTINVNTAIFYSAPHYQEPNAGNLTATVWGGEYTVEDGYIFYVNGYAHPKTGDEYSGALYFTVHAGKYTAKSLVYQAGTKQGTIGSASNPSLIKSGTFISTEDMIHTTSAKVFVTVEGGSFDATGDFFSLTNSTGKIAITGGKATAGRWGIYLTGDVTTALTDKVKVHTTSSYANGVITDTFVEKVADVQIDIGGTAELTSNSSMLVMQTKIDVAVNISGNAKLTSLCQSAYNEERAGNINEMFTRNSKADGVWTKLTITGTPTITFSHNQMFTITAVGGTASNGSFFDIDIDGGTFIQSSTTTAGTFFASWDWNGAMNVDISGGTFKWANATEGTTQTQSLDFIRNQGNQMNVKITGGTFENLRYFAYGTARSDTGVPTANIEISNGAITTANCTFYTAGAKGNKMNVVVSGTAEITSNLTDANTGLFYTGNALHTMNVAIKGGTLNCPNGPIFGNTGAMNAVVSGGTLNAKSLINMNGGSVDADIEITGTADVNLTGYVFIDAPNANTSQTDLLISGGTVDALALFPSNMNGTATVTITGGYYNGAGHVKNENGVAAIGTSYYASLQEAINAVDNTNGTVTITLIGVITVDTTVVINKNVIITGEGDKENTPLLVYGAVTATAPSDGSVLATFQIVAGYAVTFSGNVRYHTCGFFVEESTEGQSTTVTFAGNVEIINTEISATNLKSYAFAARNADAKGTLTVNLEGNAHLTARHCIILTSAGMSYAVNIKDNATLTSIASTCVYVSGGSVDVKMSGGTIDGSSNAFQFLVDSNVEITGGTFNVNGNVILFRQGNHSLTMKNATVTKTSTMIQVQDGGNLGTAESPAVIENVTANATSEIYNAAWTAGTTVLHVKSGTYTSAGRAFCGRSLNDTIIMGEEKSIGKNDLLTVTVTDNYQVFVAHHELNSAGGGNIAANRQQFNLTIYNGTYSTPNSFFDANKGVGGSITIHSGIMTSTGHSFDLTGGAYVNDTSTQEPIGYIAIDLTVLGGTFTTNGYFINANCYTGVIRLENVTVTSCVKFVQLTGGTSYKDGDKTVYNSGSGTVPAINDSISAWLTANGMTTVTVKEDLSGTPHAIVWVNNVKATVTDEALRMQGCGNVYVRIAGDETEINASGYIMQRNMYVEPADAWQVVDITGGKMTSAAQAGFFFPGGQNAVGTLHIAFNISGGEITMTRAAVNAGTRDADGKITSYVADEHRGVNMFQIFKWAIHAYLNVTGGTFTYAPVGTVGEGQIAPQTYFFQGGNNFSDVTMTGGTIQGFGTAFWGNYSGKGLFVTLGEQGGSSYPTINVTTAIFYTAPHYYETNVGNLTATVWGGEYTVESGYIFYVNGYNHVRELYQNNKNTWKSGNMNFAVHGGTFNAKHFLYHWNGNTGTASVPATIDGDVTINATAQPFYFRDNNAYLLLDSADIEVIANTHVFYAESPMDNLTITINGGTYKALVPASATDADRAATKYYQGFRIFSLQCENKDATNLNVTVNGGTFESDGEFMWVGRWRNRNITVKAGSINVNYERFIYITEGGANAKGNIVLGDAENVNVNDKLTVTTHAKSGGSGNQLFVNHNGYFELTVYGGTYVSKAYSFVDLNGGNYVGGKINVLGGDFTVNTHFIDAEGSNTTGADKTIVLDITVSGGVINAGSRFIHAKTVTGTFTLSGGTVNCQHGFVVQGDQPTTKFTDKVTVKTNATQGAEGGLTYTTLEEAPDVIIIVTGGTVTATHSVFHITTANNALVNVSGNDTVLTAKGSDKLFWRGNAVSGATSRWVVLNVTDAPTFICGNTQMFSMADIASDYSYANFNIEGGNFIMNSTATGDHFFFYNGDWQGIMSIDISGGTFKWENNEEGALKKGSIRGIAADAYYTNIELANATFEGLDVLIDAKRAAGYANVVIDNCTAKCAVSTFRASSSCVTAEVSNSTITAHTLTDISGSGAVILTDDGSNTFNVNTVTNPNYVYIEVDEDTYGYATFEGAVNHAPDGATAYVVGNLTVSSTATLDSKLTITGKGNVSGSVVFITLADGAELILGGDVTYSGTTNIVQVASDVTGTVSVTFGKGTYLVSGSGKACAVFLDQSLAANTTVNVIDGAYIKVGGWGVAFGDDRSTDGSGTKTVNMTGGYLSGSHGITFAMGGVQANVTVSGGTIETVNENFYVDNKQFNANGQNNVVSLTVTGGEFITANRMITFRNDTAATVTISDITVDGAKYVVYMESSATVNTTLNDVTATVQNGVVVAYDNTTKDGKCKGTVVVNGGSYTILSDSFLLNDAAALTVKINRSNADDKEPVINAKKYIAYTYDSAGATYTVKTDFVITAGAFECGSGMFIYTNDATGTVTISGGTFNCTLNSSNGTANGPIHADASTTYNISGGTFTSMLTPMFGQSGTLVANLSGGEFYCGYLLNSNGAVANETVNISGNAAVNADIAVLTDGTKGSKMNLNIAGGKVVAPLLQTGPFQITCVVTFTGGELTVRDVTMNGNVIGSVNVVLNETTGTYYTTLEEAVAKAADKDVLVLTSNVIVIRETVVVENKSITIKGGTPEEPIKVVGIIDAPDGYYTRVYGTFKVLSNASVTFTGDVEYLETAIIAEGDNVTVTFAGNVKFDNARRSDVFYNNNSFADGDVTVYVTENATLMGNYAVYFTGNDAMTSTDAVKSAYMSGGLVDANHGFLFQNVNGVTGYIELTGGIIRTQSTGVYLQSANVDGKRITVVMDGITIETNGLGLNTEDSEMLVDVIVKGNTFIHAGMDASGNGDYCIEVMTKENDKPSTVTVYGGTFITGTGHATIQVTSSCAVRENATEAKATSATIYGGYFKAGANSTVRASSGGYLYIFGGYFCFDADPTSGGGPVRLGTGSDAEATVGNAYVYGGNFVSKSVGAAVNCINDVSSAVVYAAGMNANGGSHLLNSSNSSVDKIYYPDGLAHADGLISMTDGAGVRIVEGSNGLRFVSVISAEALEYLASIGATVVKFGTLIAPTDVVEQSRTFTIADLDAAGLPYLNIEAKDGLVARPAGGYYIRAAITNIKEGNYGREFAAVGYVTYTLEVNGETLTFTTYTSYRDTKNARSIEQVARLALRDGDSYSAAQQAILAQFAPTTEAPVIDFYLMAGQSNAAGSSQFSDAIASLKPEYTEGYSNIFYSGSSNRARRIGVPMKIGYGSAADSFGAELGMADALSQYYNEETGRYAAIIKYAYGGTRLYDNITGSDGVEGNWMSPSWIERNGCKDEQLSGGLFRAFIAHIESCVADYEAMGYEVNIKGVYWMQGESDISANGKDNLYDDMFKCWVEDVRSSVSAIMGDESYMSLPIFVGEISEYFGSNSGELYHKYNLEFVQMQREIIGSWDNVYVIPQGNVPTVDWPDDNSHWGYHEHLWNGYQSGSKMLEVLYGFSTTVSEEDAVAEIWLDGELLGTYNTLGGAISMAPEGAVVKLIKDIQLYNTLAIGNRNKITLDGCGHKIDFTPKQTTVGNYSAIKFFNTDITVKDLHVVNHSYTEFDADGNETNLATYGAVLNFNAKVTWIGGSLEAERHGFVMNNDECELTIVSGDFKLRDTAIGYAAIIFTGAKNTKITVEGGNFDGGVGTGYAVYTNSSASGAKIVLNGGTFKAGDDAANVIKGNSTTSTIIVGENAVLIGGVDNAGLSQ